jgi:hypothetical protein
VELPVVPRRGNRYVRIINVHDHRVVAAIELLSPSNKTLGRDRDAYLAKRDEYLASGVNLVEVDLLRAGLRPPLGAPPTPSAYYALVCWASLLPRAGYWSIGVRDRLPEVPVPLDADKPDCLLDLQPCFDRAYDEGRFPLYINYTQPPTPPLPEADAAWARELLARHMNQSPPATGAQP